MTAQGGRANAIPGAIMFSLLGAGGQGIVNSVEARRSRETHGDSSEPAEAKPGFIARWSPLKPLSDEKYLAILQDKVLRVDAEVALIDEEVQRLKTVEK